MWNLIDYNRPIGETTMMKIKTSIILSVAEFRFVDRKVKRHLERGWENVEFLRASAI